MTTPMNTLNHITKDIKRIMWWGGKTNTQKNSTNKLEYNQHSKQRTRGLDKPSRNIKASQIWKLIKTTFPLIQNQLTWIPRNGKSIRIWTDNI